MLFSTINAYLMYLSIEFPDIIIMVHKHLIVLR